jgi:hypothetical protein
MGKGNSQKYRKRVKLPDWHQACMMKGSLPGSGDLRRATGFMLE